MRIISSNIFTFGYKSEKIMKTYKKLGDKNSIWRILISPQGKLLLETRDENKKIVHFYISDLNIGKNNLTEIPHDEEYWVGVESFSDDFLITHGFAKPDMPGHLGIAVYSLEEKKYLWDDKSAVFLFRKGESIFTFQQTFDSRSYSEIEIKTGNKVSDYGDDHIQIKSLMNEARESEDYSMYGFPNPAGPDSPVLSTVEDTCNLINVEFLSHNDYILFSYHIEKNGRYYSYLKIYRSGKLIDELELNSKTERLIAESWFMYKDLLITIENKNLLKIYRLD